MKFTRKLFKAATRGNRKYALLASGLILVLFTAALIIGGTIINNPTAAQVTFTQTWANGDGSSIPDIHNANISGTITCLVTPSAIGVLESVDIAGYGSAAVPYWISSLYLEVKGVTDPSYFKTIPLSKPSGYDASINAWGAAWVTSVLQHTQFTANVPAVAAWTLTLNTVAIPNGAYNFALKAAWTGPTIPAITIPTSPP